MPGLIVLESMWNKKGGLLDEEPSVLPYLKAICQSMAWEGIPVNLVYRRFYSNYDLGLLLEEVRRRRIFQICYIASHGQRRKLVGFGEKVIRLESLIEHCRPSPRIGYIFGACDFVTPDTAQKFLAATCARFVAGYQKAIPWTESMLVDCLFLSYLLGGTMKWVRTKHGDRIPPLRDLEDFEITRSQNPQKVAGPALPRLHALPRHHLLVLHARSRPRPQASARQLLRSVPAKRRARAPPRARHLEEAAMALGEAPIKAAVRWIEEQLQDRPDADRVTLVDEASRRFDLTPLDEDFLVRHLAQRGSGPKK